MKQKLSIASVVLGAWFSSCSFFSSTISTIISFDVIKQEIESVDQSTLVIFDCDDTILEPDEPLIDFSKSQNHPFITAIRREFMDYSAQKSDPQDYADEIMSQIFQKSSYRPIEQSMIATIRNLTHRGVKVMALTGQETGPLFGGRISRFEEWRYQKLASIGVDFSNSFPEKDLTLDSLPHTTRGIPTFYKGILCSADQPKGTVLGAFLDQIGYKPARVIFIDDEFGLVESVAQEMKKRSIPFRGYVYRAAYQKPLKVDEQVLRVQLDYVKQHDQFITEDDARDIVENITIKPIDSMKQAQKQLAKLDRSALVVFDVDGTLITQKDNILQLRNEFSPLGRKLSALHLRDIKRFKNESDIKKFYSKIINTSEFMLCEACIPSLIKKLQRRGIKTVALTHMQVGPSRSGDVKRLEIWRSDQLKNLGVDFSTSFPYDQLPLTTFAPCDRGFTPLFYHGILATHNRQKGEVLGAFLDKAGFTPSQIVFFDDRKNYLRSVAHECKKRNIPFLGYHYHGADFVPGELNEAVAQFQLDYYLQHEVWISEQEAIKKMGQ